MSKRKKAKRASESRRPVSRRTIASARRMSPIWARATDRGLLRNWWHDTLRVYGKYSCYAVFLMLPSDKEILSYLTENGKELDLISGENCLVLAFSESEFKTTEFSESEWRELVEEHTGEGYSRAVANLFDIDFTRFPCMVAFQDIRKPDHVVFELGGMNVEEIARRMRLVFSIIERSIRDEKDPLQELEKQLKLEISHASDEVLQGKLDKGISKTLMDVLIAMEGQGEGQRNIVFIKEYVGGNKTTVGDVHGSEDVAIGQGAQADVRGGGSEEEE